MDKQQDGLLHNRSVQDKAYDLFGELLIQRQAERLLKEIEEEKVRGETAEMDVFFAVQDRVYLAQIQAYSRRQRVKQFFQHTLPKIGQIAAIMIAVLSLAGGAAIAASHTVRVCVLQMLVNIEKQYTEIELVEDEASSFDVPTGWKGSSYLSYIPDGLELTNINSVFEINHVEYTDSHTGQIVLYFDELDDSAASNVDTEGALVQKIAVNGQTGYMAVKNGVSNVFWADGHNYFLLTTKGIEDAQTIAIANGVRRIK